MYLLHKKYLASFSLNIAEEDGKGVDINSPHADMLFFLLFDFYSILQKSDIIS